MGATFFYEEDHYPPHGDHGRADEEKSPVKISVFDSNFYDAHQVYLRLEPENGEKQEFHFTKEQAEAIGRAFIECQGRIGYDNTK